MKEKQKIGFRYPIVEFKEEDESYCTRCNGTGKVSNKDAIILWLWERAPEWYLNFLYERRKND